MNETPLDEVYIVLQGREGEDGNYADAEVERVYRTRRDADEYVSAVEHALEFDEPRAMWWVEQWPVLVTLWDERVGDEGMEA